VTDGTPNKIVSAALRTSDGRVWSLPPPARHTDLIRFVFEACADAMIDGAAEQGFVDSRGDFLCRVDAAAVAFGAGQIATLMGTLYSEDMW